MTLQAQILANRFAALAREGAESFRRMARSPLVIEEGAYACALLDRDARLIAQEQGEPSQLCAVQASCAHLLDAFAFNLAEGDVILTGDPYCGGTQGGTLTLVVPVFLGGDLHYLAALRFAAPDLAGNVPGNFQPDAHEVWQESLRVTPVKLARGGAPQADVKSYIRLNTRAPEIVMSDIGAALAVAEVLAGKLAALCAEKGEAAVAGAADYAISYARARAEALLAALPEGEGQGEGVRVTVSQAPFRVDFTGSASASEGASNLTRAATSAVVLTELLAPLIDEIGTSQGLLDAVALTLPEGSCVNAPFPAAVSLGWRDRAPQVAQALAQATGRLPALGPPGPLMMLFSEIGTNEVTVPLTLSPGFPPCAGAAGGDAFAGRRVLVSAEEAEAGGLYRLTDRALTDTGMTAGVELLAPGLEGIVVTDGATITQEAGLHRPRSNVLSLAQGAVIRFDYARRAGEGEGDEPATH